MKRYLLTAGDRYYPNSGAGDWLASYDSLEEIPFITRVEKSSASNYSNYSIEGFSDYYDGVEIVDTVKFKTIFSIDSNDEYKIGEVVNVIDKVEQEG